MPSNFAWLIAFLHNVRLMCFSCFIKIVIKAYISGNQIHRNHSTYLYSIYWNIQPANQTYIIAFTFLAPDLSALTDIGLGGFTNYHFAFYMQNYTSTNIPLL